MQHDFWHQRWQSNQIGFHLAETNPQLVTHFNALKLTPPSPAASPRVFIPLCGKTLDIAWLIAQGYQVVGVELSKIAIEALFSQLNISPIISQTGNLTHFSSKKIDIFVGDIFQLTPATLGKVDAVYDRAALVALPTAMRQAYTAHLLTLGPHAPQLLVCFDYDISLHKGPPFSVPAQELHQHYATSHHLTLLAANDIEGGLKGVCPATEQVWLLTPKD